jgi:hypothetical protein
MQDYDGETSWKMGTLNITDTGDREQLISIVSNDRYSNISLTLSMC